MKPPLTQSQEDYLETIFGYVKKDGHAHVRDIAEALGVRARHELLERFMRLVLGVDKDTASDNACRMEHAISEEVLERLAAYVAFVDRCPVKACTWHARENGFCGHQNVCRKGPSGSCSE